MTAAIQTPAHRRILVVDDDEDASSALAISLTAKGHQVQIAWGGEAALDTLAGYQPDLVILDLRMPGTDGFEVARRLRAEKGPRPLIVALSGYDDVEYRLRAFTAGCDLHLVKPCSAEALLSFAASAERLLPAPANR